MIKSEQCSACGGYCAICGRPGLLRDPSTVRWFIRLTPYFIAMCIGALIATFLFEHAIPGSMRASWAKSAAANCEMAASYCRDACE